MTHSFKDQPSMDSVPSRRAWLLASLTPLFALAIFRPWVREAFPAWDYPQVLPILEAHPGVWNGAMAIAEWNRPDGRANYLSYFQFSSTWGLVGGDSVGWQISRALIMLAVGVLIVQVGRRLGATPIASAVAACVFLVAVPSTEGWLLLAGEQLATLLLLLAVLAAAGYTTTPAWRVRGLLIALLCALVMLAKEVLGLCLPMVVLLALCWDPRTGFRRPATGPRERWLVALLLLVLVLEAWSVRSAMQDAVVGNYASAFGRDGFDQSRALTLFQAMLLPARFSSASAATTLYPANFAFLLLLLLGLIWPAAKDRPARGGGWWALGLLWYPVVGALAYTLWPRYTAYYGIPFFAGSAGLLAVAASRIERRHPLGGGLLVAGLGAVVIFFAGIASARTVRQKHATAAIAAAVSRAWLTAPRLDTLLVVTPPQGGRRWPLSARELRNYAVFLGAADSALPLMLDASCDEVIQRLQRPLNRSAVLNDQNPCGRIPQQTVTWEKSVGYLDWASLRRVADTLRVDLLAPSWPPSARRTDPL